MQALAVWIQLKMSVKLYWESQDDSDFIIYLAELYNSKQFFDITVVCKDQRVIQAHRAVLAANSKMFQHLLRDSEDTEIIFDEVAVDEVLSWC